ncbi:hypothetical protein ZHAS_00012135 [Anopheles sinensis]|uniref:Uncharacterized protein n=1 Tax=Anopheles sinensis TaxID=74873 RepID=A0A084W1Z7_ANOSI|nr:hypothetical protein ZHAS_00012135 [Anopheles sinensis]
MQTVSIAIVLLLVLAELNTSYTNPVPHLCGGGGVTGPVKFIGNYAAYGYGGGYGLPGANGGYGYMNGNKVRRRRRKKPFFVPPTILIG